MWLFYNLYTVSKDDRAAHKFTKKKKKKVLCKDGFDIRLFI